MITAGDSLPDEPLAARASSAGIFLALLKVGGEHTVRFLIVDDDKTFCRFLAEVLENRGYQVDWCSRALEGYKMSQRKHYDFMVFDVRMPVLLGTELAEALKQQSPGSKIILISAFADEALQKTAVSLGVPLLSKPFTTDRFLGLIAQESQH